VKFCAIIIIVVIIIISSSFYSYMKYIAQIRRTIKKEYRIYKRPKKYDTILGTNILNNSCYVIKGK